MVRRKRTDLPRQSFDRWTDGHTEEKRRRVCVRPMRMLLGLWGETSWGGGGGVDVVVEPTTQCLDAVWKRENGDGGGWEFFRMEKSCYCCCCCCRRPGQRRESECLLSEEHKNCNRRKRRRRSNSSSSRSTGDGGWTALFTSFLSLSSTSLSLTSDHFWSLLVQSS